MSLGFNSVMFVLLATAVVALRRRQTLRAWWMALGLLLMAAGGVLALIRPPHFLLLALICWLLFVHLPLFLAAGAWVQWRATPWSAKLAAGVAASIAVIGVDAFWIEPTHLEITHLTIHSSKLSRPVRVVVLADIQMDNFGAYEQQAFRLTLDQHPDLILLAGDYLQASPEKRLVMQHEVNSFLRSIEFHAPRGVYAIRGNVDKGNWAGTFDDLAIHVVEQTEVFDLPELRLSCLSCNDSFNYQTHLPAPPGGRFHLLLGHSPEYALGPSQADLALAGHTHGGQVRLPLLGPVTTLSDLPRHNGAGLSLRPNGEKMYVSRGVGMERGDAPRLRFLCRPELTVIDLLPEEPPQRQPDRSGAPCPTVGSSGAGRLTYSEP